MAYRRTFHSLLKRTDSTGRVDIIYT